MKSRISFAIFCLVLSGCVSDPSDSRSTLGGGAPYGQKTPDGIVAKEARTDDGLIDVTSDIEAGTTSLKAVVSEGEGDLLALRLVRPGAQPERIELGAMRSGSVLYRKSGRDVLTLFATDVDSRNGGAITLRYLNEGKLIGRDVYRNFEMRIQREGDDWKLNADGQNGLVPFTQMYLVGKKNGLGMVVGVDRILVR